ncbi:MAG: nucleotide exchange factor GrpE [Betaproteobacteria bacterium]|nr:nucleotide exchange factor GrpE [Betaproteobacteria bacterium]
MQNSDPSQANPQTPANDDPIIVPDRATQDAKPAEPTPEERIAAAEHKAAENYDQWLRTRAEMENVRRRAQEDIAKAHKFAIESLVTGMLPVRDSLEATLAVEGGTLEALRNGVELTLKQLIGLFEKSGVREINPPGEKFDPHKHQAISMLPSEQETNTVISVLQKGYMLNERVIRPAFVTVAKAKDT